MRIAHVSHDHDGSGRPVGPLFVVVVSTREVHGLGGCGCGKIREKPYAIWTSCHERDKKGPPGGPIETNSQRKGRK